MNDIKSYTLDTTELDVVEMTDMLRRIHQQQERLARERRAIETELINRASESVTSNNRRSSK